MGKALVVNFYGGQDAGKSIVCAGVFSELKMRGVRCEMALEYVKDKVWEKSTTVLNDQLYVFANQWHRIWWLLDKVDVILTDSPLLFSLVYDEERDPYLRNLILNKVATTPNLHYYIARSKNSYDVVERLHTEPEALALDAFVESNLNYYGVPYSKVLGTSDGIQTITGNVYGILQEKIKSDTDEWNVPSFRPRL